MIHHDLERATRGYLTAVTGALVRTSGDELVDDDGFDLVASPEGLPGYQSDGGLGVLTDEQGVPLDGGLQFRFYLGENNSKIEQPCAIIAAENGDIEMETGNETVRLSVTTRVPANAYTGASEPLATGQEITEALKNALYRADAADYLNLYRGTGEVAERLTIIGIVERSNSKTQLEQHVEHAINMTIYCAGRNLDPTLPLQS